LKLLYYATYEYRFFQGIGQGYGICRFFRAISTFSVLTEKKYTILD